MEWGLLYTDSDDEVVLVAERGNGHQQQAESEDDLEEEWLAMGTESPGDQELASHNTRRLRQRGRFVQGLNAAAPRHGMSGDQRRAPEPPPRLAQLAARGRPMPEPPRQVTRSCGT